MMYIGIDPGYSGAWGMIDHNGKYQSCGDMLHNEKHILSRLVHAEISQALEQQDLEVIIEMVHSMPGQGVSSSFKFGMAFGAAIAITERFNCVWHMVTPQKWKKALQLDSDKQKSLDLARQLWPNAPLLRKKDNGRAEALLLAEYLRREQLDI
jgi:Holliday junction resolvasome RuvABC endonuclease subunit